MKIVFFGTSIFAARILSYLLDHNVSIVAAVTRPDRPKGRSLKISPSAVKELITSQKPDLPLYQPEKASTDAFAAQLEEYHPDLFVVVAYGEIIKKNLLSLPKNGCINVHASLLPKYRGAAPIQRCLMHGESKTGVTIMDMVLEMDAGDMIKTVEMDISPEMNYGELELALSTLAAPALLEVIHGIERGQIKKTPQDPSKVTFAPKITPKEEEIDWYKSASDIHNLIRALSPAPSAWCQVHLGGFAKRLKIKKAVVEYGMAGKPGEILLFGKEGLIIACGKDALRLLEVQLEGKKMMTAKEFIQGVQHSVAFVIN